MITITMNLFSPKGNCLSLTYCEQIGKDRFFIADDKGECVCISNEDMYQAMESLFKLRGNNEPIK